MEPLSNIEIFYSEYIDENRIYLIEDEINHCINVFRKKINDIIFITDGKGNLYKAKIFDIKKEKLASQIIEKISFQNTTENIFICIPLLKNKDRFRFAIEKSVEMGITRFFFFNSDRSITSKFDETKTKKIMIETLKQSIRTFLPDFKFFTSFKEMIRMINNVEQIFVFDLESKGPFNKNLTKQNQFNFFIFGPEGGLSKLELDLIPMNRIFKLSSGRLRSETAIVKLVSIIT